MSRLSLPFLLGWSILTTGCVPFLAGAAGGAIVANEDQSVERYIDTHDVEPRIARALYAERIVKGMTKQEAGVVMGETQYECENIPMYTAEVDTSKWVCEKDDPKWTGKYVIEFRKGKVTDSEAHGVPREDL